MTDNGREFNSDKIREIFSILNVQPYTTSGMSPYPNGLCECDADKLEAENSEVILETLLLWANMARNSLQMWNGFSSNQLVFRKTPDLLNIMQAELPALEGSTSSKTFHKHMNALHEVCKAYIQSEADERIRCAWWSKVRASEQFLTLEIWSSINALRWDLTTLRLSNSKFTRQKEKMSSDKLHYENDKPGKEKK